MNNSSPLAFVSPANPARVIVVRDVAAECRGTLFDTHYKAAARAAARAAGFSVFNDVRALSGNRRVEVPIRGRLSA